MTRQAAGAARWLIANLRGADLSVANLRGADLRGTCLDPAAPIPPVPDADILAAGLEIEGDRVPEPPVDSAGSAALGVGGPRAGSEAEDALQRGAERRVA